jgi:hypothetical protein
MKGNIITISPFSGIWQHALPETYLINHLSQNFDIIKLNCDGTFSHHCTVMESYGIPIDSSDVEKIKACKSCKFNSNLLENNFNFKSLKFSHFIQDEDLIYVDKLVSNLNTTELINYKEDDCEIGKIALYEVLIKFKKTDLNLNELENKYYTQYFWSTMIAFQAIKKVYQLYNPVYLFAYSPQYSIPGICLDLSVKMGIKSFFIEGSSNINDRYKALRIWNWNKFGLTNPALQFWDKKYLYNISKYSNNAKKHFEALKSARSFSVYSEPSKGNFDIYNYFNISKSNKIYLATMSSYDEVFSAYIINKFPSNKYNSNVFKDQFEWILETINFFTFKDNATLIIRIHPRTFVSERNKIESNEALFLKKIFNNLPKNIKVNTPDQKISLYDILPKVDLLITGWSATSIEALYYGVNVITYDQNLPSFPKDIHYTGTTRNEYFDNLNLIKFIKTKENNFNNAKDWWSFNALGVIKHPWFLNEIVIYLLGNFGIFINKFTHYFLKKILKKLDIQIFKYSKVGKVDINILLNYDTIYEMKTNKNEYYKKNL